ncbi:MAG TPA: P1 family peptidase [Ktedonobacteraceae bacterium]|nr:P1 family peptidase [Ktedonobacteraceae bacterium]
MAMHDDITDIPGIRVGHVTNLEAGTGCTVVLCDTPAIGGVDVRGGAPATRETDLLRPMHLIENVNAVLLAGGSAFGLDAASGVMRYLEERNIGHDTFVARVPIVPAAAIFDLAFGAASIRPDASYGYRACELASTGPVAQGNVGAGTGATCNKTRGPMFALKGGLGSASTQLPDGTLVGAIVVVNAFGDVINPETQQPFGSAGQLPQSPQSAQDIPPANPSGNTTIAVVATNASLSKDAVNKMAQMAQNGLAQAIRPAHTMFDGDTAFALALGQQPQTPLDAAGLALQTSLIGAAAASTLARAIVKAILNATPLHGVPAATS